MNLKELLFLTKEFVTANWREIVIASALLVIGGIMLFDNMGKDYNNTTGGLPPSITDI